MADFRDRRLARLNVGMRVCNIVQQSINEIVDDPHFVTFYEISPGPNEFARVFVHYERPGKPMVYMSKLWDLQIVLDLERDAERVINLQARELVRLVMEQADKLT